MGGGNSPVQGIGIWREVRGKPERRNDHACKALAYGLLELFGALRPRHNSGRKSSEIHSYLRKGIDDRAKKAHEFFGTDQPTEVIHAQ